MENLNKGHNLQELLALDPLFYYHTSFSSETKCGISFMDVGPETFKVINKMWKRNKGLLSKGYVPLAPILPPHVLFFRDQVW